MYDLIIIGAGPAGITAGIYAKRANLKCMVIEKGAPGGQMINTLEVENYTGFNKIGGADLALEMFNHGLALGVEYVFDEVIEVISQKANKVVTANNTYETKAIIIATGATPRKLGLKNEDALISRGISFCAICDGPIYKNKDVVVVGGGNSAVEEASYLASLAKSVTVVQNLKNFTADKKAIDILLSKENVNVYYESLITEFVINDENQLIGVKINRQNKSELTIKTDGVFEYIGLKPETKIFKNLNILNEYGYVLTNPKMETSIKGIYAVGDVRDKEIRQILTAANDGVIAVQNILKYLETWD